MNTNSNTIREATIKVIFNIAHDTPTMQRNILLGTPAENIEIHVKVNASGVQDVEIQFVQYGEMSEDA